MSIAAMTWALDVHQTGPMSPDARLVLVALADYASHDGTGVYPVQETLAERLGITSRAIRRNIVTLKELGILVLGDQELVAHYPGNRRPVVYDLAMKQGSRGDGTPRADATVPPRADATVPPDTQFRADSAGRLGGTLASYKPRTKPTTKPPYPPPPVPPASDVVRAANSQRPDGSCRRCDALHPAGTSCQVAARDPLRRAATVRAELAAARLASGHQPRPAPPPDPHPHDDQRLAQIRAHLDPPAHLDTPEQEHQTG